MIELWLLECQQNPFGVRIGYVGVTVTDPILGDHTLMIDGRCRAAWRSRIWGAVVDIELVGTVRPIDAKIGVERQTQ